MHSWATRIPHSHCVSTLCSDSETLKRLILLWKHVLAHFLLLTQNINQEFGMISRICFQCFCQVHFPSSVQTSSTGFGSLFFISVCDRLEWSLIQIRRMSHCTGPVWWGTTWHCGRKTLSEEAKGQNVWIFPQGQWRSFTNLKHAHTSRDTVAHHTWQDIAKIFIKIWF